MKSAYFFSILAPALLLTTTFLSAMEIADNSEQELTAENLAALQNLITDEPFFDKPLEINHNPTNQSIGTSITNDLSNSTGEEALPIINGNLKKKWVGHKNEFGKIYISDFPQWDELIKIVGKESENYLRFYTHCTNSTVEIKSQIKETALAMHQQHCNTDHKNNTPCPKPEKRAMFVYVYKCINCPEEHLTITKMSNKRLFNQFQNSTECSHETLELFVQAVPSNTTIEKGIKKSLADRHFPDSLRNACIEQTEEFAVSQPQKKNRSDHSQETQSPAKKRKNEKPKSF